MDAVHRIPDYMSTDQKSHISQVVKDVGRRLMRFIRARVASDEDAEDVLQEVWQQFAVTLETGPVERASAWLYRVARNRIIDRYRKPKTTSLEALIAEAEEEDSGLDLVEFLLRDDKTPQTEHLHRRFWEQLHAALAELPEAQRQVFVWHELDALSFQDIAALTGENLNTLLARKRYAVLHLRRRLAPLRDEYFSTPNRLHSLS